MTPVITPEDLRNAFLSATDPMTVRVLSLSGAVLLTGTVLWLLRRRGLREEYTPIWMGVAFSLLAIALWPGLLHALTRALGAWTPSSTVFFLGEAFLVAICLNYAVRLSRNALQIKNLAQEMALLRAQLERLEGGSAGRR
jgi:hypothetical protein